VYRVADIGRPGSDLRKRVDETLKNSPRLTVELTHSIYSQYLVEPAEQALMAVRSNLLGLVEQVKQTVHQAGRDTAGFDSRLNDFQQEI